MTAKTKTASAPRNAVKAPAPRNAKVIRDEQRATARVTKPVAPRKVSVAEQRNTALQNISRATSRALRGDEGLIEALRAFATKPNKDDMKAMRDASLAGYIADRIAAKAGRAEYDDSDMVAAVAIMHKAGAKSKPDARRGNRTDAEEAMLNAFANFWHVKSKAAGIAPQREGGAGRKPRTTKAQENVAGVDVTTGRGPNTAPPSHSMRFDAPAPAMAFFMQYAGVLLAAAEGNAKVLGKARAKAIIDAMKAIMALPA